MKRDIAEVVNPLTDPESLRDHPDVEFREERTVTQQTSFDYFASIDGLAAVGITNEEGAILLMNSPHGWRLPYGPINPEEDWITGSQRIGENLTGVTITVSGVERVAKITHYIEGSRHESITYDVIFRAVPLTGQPVASSPSFGPWDELELEWFDTVPEDAYWEHGDAVDDIRLFIR